MKRVAKLIIVDGNGDYLLLRRNNHPVFYNDSDIPGGTAEAGELVGEALVREVLEETGLFIDANEARLVCSTNDYSSSGTEYFLYIIDLDSTPEIHISDEHSSFKWLSRDAFIKNIENAEDSYVHMVYDALNGSLKDAV